MRDCPDLIIIAATPKCPNAANYTASNHLLRVQDLQLSPQGPNQSYSKGIIVLSLLQSLKIGLVLSSLALGLLMIGSAFN